MPRDVRKYLWDIQQACKRVVSFTAHQTLKSYRTDPLVQAGVERQFEIIGEAMNQMLKQQPNMRASFPEAANIIALRNMLIHGYRYIDHAEVWQIVQQHLPPLHEQVDRLLKEQSES